MSAVPAATPLFVVGLNRSGTKWLSNTLCQHAEVAGVLHERFTGILETNMLDTIPRVFPDLREGDDYAAVIELWSATEFFGLTVSTQDDHPLAVGFLILEPHLNLISYGPVDAGGHVLGSRIDAICTIELLHLLHRGP